MAGLTRRQLFGRSLGAAGAGAALVGGGAMLPALLATRAEADTTAMSGGDLVVHVRPGSSGEVRVMSGDRELVVHDAQLANRLRRAAG